MKVILSGDFGDGGRLFLQKLDHVALELTAESATRLIPITRLRQHRFPPIFDGNLFSLFGGDAQDGTDRAVTGYAHWPRHHLELVFRARRSATLGIVPPDCPGYKRRGSRS